MVVSTYKHNSSDFAYAVRRVVEGFEIVKYSITTGLAEMKVVGVEHKLNLVKALLTKGFRCVIS